MKNQHYESLGRRMRAYHRAHPWRLSEGGLYIPHAYWDITPESLSYWDDVGFIQWTALYCLVAAPAGSVQSSYRIHGMGRSR